MANENTVREFEYAKSKGLKHHIHETHLSNKNGIKMDAIYFFENHEEINHETIKVFAYVEDFEENRGRLDFLGELSWKSHAIDFDMGYASHMVDEILNHWLIDTALVPLVKHTQEEEFKYQEISYSAVDDLYKEED